MERLWADDGVVVEHILSGRLTGPADHLQEHDEWVAVLEGSAELEVRDEPLALAAGDWVLLPRGTPHRLLSTEPGTRWLAVHVGRSGTGATEQGGRRMSPSMDLNHLNLRVRDAGGCREFYERHFGFRHAFDAEGGHFLRNDARFLLAVCPADLHRPLPEGVHIGFGLDEADQVTAQHRSLAAAGVAVSPIDDHRPSEDYVTFRCWDPDGTEIEVFWDGA